MEARDILALISSPGDSPTTTALRYSPTTTTALRYSHTITALRYIPSVKGC